MTIIVLVTMTVEQAISVLRELEAVDSVPVTVFTTVVAEKSVNSGSPSSVVVAETTSVLDEAGRSETAAFP